MFFVVGPWWNRAWSDLNVFFCTRSLVKQCLARFQIGVEAIRMICVCRWSSLKQGLGLFEWSVFVAGPAWNRGWRDFNVSFYVCSSVRQGLRLLGCSVFALGPARNRGWTYSEAIRTICVCHWSAVKQGWARFQSLFLCLVRRETRVGAIRRNCFCIVFVVGPAWNRCWSYPWKWSLSSVLGETGFGLSSAVAFAIGPWQIKRISESGRLLEPSRNPKKYIEKDIGNPYKTLYLEQRFGQPEARLYSWRCFCLWN